MIVIAELKYYFINNSELIVSDEASCEIKSFINRKPRRKTSWKKIIRI